MLGAKVPTANIAVNKSRVKLYKKAGQLPTYYLQKGQEFQIELFNPTTDTILAKITLNNKIISQGGLVLRPGQRVFLERFLDVEKKFLFDTYEVSNTSEVKEAIKNNGDFKVEFFKESVTNPILLVNNGTLRTDGIFRPWGGNNYQNINYTAGYSSMTTSNSAPYTLTSVTTGNAYYGSSSTMGSLSTTNLSTENNLRNTKRSTKTIETGTVEQGSKSEQKFNTVDKTFDTFAFYSVECKILPISQKINTSEDLNVKKYCTNCGAKLGKTDKFCSQCGNKA